MVTREKSGTRIIAEQEKPGNWTTGAATIGAAEPPPTFLALERRQVQLAMTELHRLQDLMHEQQKVVARHRENCDLLADNPWAEKLFSELLEREITARDKAAIQTLVGQHTPVKI